jgi:hypothetical protein
MPNLNSYGFLSFQDIAEERVTGSNIAVIDRAIRESVAEHNRQVSEVLDELVERTTEPTVRYKVPGGGTLQPLDARGNPLPVKEQGVYDVGFPIQRGGTAWGDDIESRALMTVAEVDRQTLAALRRDANWMKRHILAALLDNTSWTYEDDEKGAITVQPLANGDTVEYLRGDGSQSTDTHYYAQAAAVSDAANPFPALKAELSEHPENEGPFVAYVPTALKTSIMGLSTFRDVPDPNVRLGDGQEQLVGRLDRGFGNEVLGYVDGVWVVEWSLLPATHGIIVARGATTKPLRMRERPVTSLQGLFTSTFSPDGNLNEYRFRRIAGFGAYNRVGALAFQIGNASYQIPAGYATPLAV